MAENLKVWNADKANTEDGAWDAKKKLLLEANAGTGKTYSLVRLVARIVRERQIPLSSILVLTFTRKAAAEMKDRLYQHLSDLHQNPSLSHDEFRLVRQSLEELPWAQVTTIHGFCFWIIRQNPDLFKIPLNLEIASSYDVANAYSVNFLRRFQLLNSPDLPSLDRQTLDSFSLSQLRNTIVNVITHPQSLLTHHDFYVHSGDSQQTETFQYTLCQQSAKEYSTYLSHQGLISYDDMIRLVHGQLCSPQGNDQLQKRLQRLFKACVVDEFQDTDLLQWEILKALFGDDQSTLVLIGDPKQSIYSFRGANLRVYREARSEIEQFGVLARLGTNYRSVKPLLDKVNQVASAIFEDTGQDWGRLSYDQTQWSLDCDPTKLPLRWAQEPGRYFSFLKFRTPHDSNTGGVDGIRRNYLDAVAAKIMQLHGKNVIDKSNQVRSLDYGDFAILAHSNDNILTAYEHLINKGIPSVIVGKGWVWKGQAAGGVWILLNFMERPSDPLRRRALLKSFWCNATIEDIDNDQSSINLALEEHLLEGVKIYERGQFVALVEWVGTWSKFWPERALNNTIGRRLITDIYHVMDILSEKFARREFYEQNPADWLGSMIVKDVSELDPENLRLERGSRAVKIMTIHNAKGLEFPVVFLMYGLSQGKPTYTSDGIGFWRGECSGRQRGVWCFAKLKENLANIQPFFESPDLPPYPNIDRQIADDEKLERKRLWYVGLTRAQLACFLPAIEPKTDIAKDLAKLYENSTFYDQEEEVLTSEATMFRTSNDPDQELWRLKPKEWARSKIVEPMVTSYTEISRAEQLRSHQNLVDLENRKDDEEDLEPGLAGVSYGLIFHKAMERWDWTQIPDPEAFLTDEVLQSLLQGQTEGANLVSVRESLVKHMSQTVQTYLTPLGKSLSELTASQVRKEIPFLLWNKKVYIKGVIDLLVRLDNKWFIIDYKTNHLPDYDQENLNKAIDKNQYSIQAEFYSDAVKRHLSRIADQAHQEDLAATLYLFVRGIQEGRGVYLA